MNVRQSVAISAMLLGFAITAAYAQNTNTNTQQSAQSGQQATANTSTTSQTPPATFHIGETWQEHLQKEMDKEAAEQKSQGQGH